MYLLAVLDGPLSHARPGTKWFEVHNGSSARSDWVWTGAHSCASLYQPEHLRAIEAPHFYAGVVVERQNHEGAAHPRLHATLDLSRA
jgi:hypothetical protein